MMALRPLRRMLARSLWVVLMRRLVAWAAFVLILLILGSVAAGMMTQVHMVRLGFLLAALSSLPLFLLWPMPERRLLDRLRRLDDEMVFEAFLEADSGPVRELLRQMAESRASALPFANVPREAWSQGLRGLCFVALLCLVLGEGLSLLVRRRSLVFAPEAVVVAGKGDRIEEQGFSDFATEDPAARRARREQALEKAEKRGSGREGVGRSTSAGHGAASSRRAPRAFDAPEDTPEDAPEGQAPPANPAGASRPGEVTRAERSSSPSGDTPRGKTGEPKASAPLPGSSSGSARGSDRGDASPAHLGTGQGYEHTGDTRVPSPLLDYRARFESRYAERTGKHVAATGRMGFGELREFQRRYFNSFTLRVDVAPGDDPYHAQLRKRWAEIKGGN